MLYQDNSYLASFHIVSKFGGAQNSKLDVNLGDNKSVKEDLIFGFDAVINHLWLYKIYFVPTSLLFQHHKVEKHQLAIITNFWHPNRNSQSLTPEWEPSVLQVNLYHQILAH